MVLNLQPRINRIKNKTANFIYKVWPPHFDIISWLLGLWLDLSLERFDTYQYMPSRYYLIHNMKN